jgi:small subunit ribosomal protein S16
MSVKIRLRRIGRKKQPSYRLVVTDTSNPRDGAYLDAVGFYNPRNNPAELRIDLEKVDTWLGKGAGMSDTVSSLVKKARRGGDKIVELKPMSGEHERPEVAVHMPAAAQPKKGAKKPAAAEATSQAEVAEAMDPGTERGAEGEADAEGAETPRP